MSKPIYKFKKRIKIGSEEFWYDLAHGGYIKAEDFSSDPATVEAIRAAVSLIKQLEKMVEPQ